MSTTALFSIAFAIAGALLPHASASAAPPVVRYTGVNIAGADFGKQVLPGTHGVNYFYPTPATIDYFAEKGMNIIRVPFRWERLQRVLNGDFDAEELGHLDAVVTYATDKQINVVLDPHNYAGYFGNKIGTREVPIQVFANFWGQLASRYKGNRRVLFGLMNEPTGLPTETWLAAANAAIAEIRQQGARNLVLVPGNGYSGAHSWFSDWYGTPNAQVMAAVVDPANNFAYEVHQYLDANASGTDPACANKEVGVVALTKFNEWARQKKVHAFLGEFGGSANPVCLAALDGMLRFMGENDDVWLGWTYWAAGPWKKTYFTSVQPLDGSDRPQMGILQKYLARKP